MNWGKAIFWGLAIFVVFIMAMCVYMFAAPVDDYDHEYYEKGLSFNADYDRERQVVTDHAQPDIKVSNKLISFVFSSAIKAKIKFMRPSSNQADRVYIEECNAQNAISLPVTNFAPGPWQLELEWQSKGKQYLYHQEVYVK